MIDPVQSLTPQLLPSASELLAQAFYDNPAHVYICPDSLTRHHQLVWLLGSNLRLQLGLSDSFCISRGSAVEAMGFWTRHDTPEIRWPTRIRVGLFAAPFRLGWTGWRRLFEVALEADIGRGPRAFRNWIMRRPPRHAD